MAKRTHEEFMKEFEEKQPKLFSEVEVLSEYENCDSKVTIKTKYGLCLSTPYSLLKGYNPTIRSAINKNEYFINQLKDTQPLLYDIIKLKSNYITNDKHIIVEIDGIDYLLYLTNLLSGTIPTIESALNKDLCFTKKAIKIHGDKYSYHLVNYTTCQKNIDIWCNKCKEPFPQVPNNHLDGKGCPKCGNNSVIKFLQENSISWSYSKWKEAGLKSKRFDSFKIYIIKCWNEEETFYKVGKTFTTIKDRFNCKKSFLYNYEIIKEIIGDAQTISELEDRLKREHKEFKYTPKTKFNGYSECFSQVNLQIARQLLPIE